MRRAPCPRCGRPDGLPTDSGMFFLAEDERRRAPDFHCAHCAHEWPDGPLPPWWPPADAEGMTGEVRDLVADELDRWYDRLTPVARAVFDEPLPVSVERLADLEPIGRLDEVFAGLVVPSDRVLQAEAVDAAAAACRALAAADAARDAERAVADARFDALEVAVEEFRRADREFGHRGHVDVLHPEPEGDDEDEWVDDEDRLCRLVATGDGEELPAAGEEWDDWLTDTASTLFDDGASPGWARYVWSRLAGSGLTTVETDVDVARAQVRLVALAVLRRTLLSRLDGDDVEDWRHGVDDPGIAPYRLGVLAGVENVEPGYGAGCAEDGEAESDALVELVRIEAGNLASAMRSALGVSGVFATTWASRYAGARYPLAPEATDEAVNANLTPEKHTTFEWVDAGMPLA